MKTYKNDTYKLSTEYPIKKIGNPDEILFFDIETTGLSAQYASVYLIGCCYFDGSDWVIKQWFAADIREEKEILADFLAFIEKYPILIHFNGNQFDIPFLKERMKKHDLVDSFDKHIGVDIYKRIFPYRRFLKLTNCKQKTLEEFMGIHRTDEYNGGELITVYKEYQKSGDSDALSLLLLHNADDVAGMFQLLPILSFADFLQEKITVKKVQCDTYKDVNGEKRMELLISFSLQTPLPCPISCRANSCYLTAKEKDGMLKVPVYLEEMKYFYADYKSYYYLPEEDVAIHRSVAGYVDPAFRQAATAATCYTRKYALYLPQWDYVFEPFFKRDYHSSNLFFELTDTFKTDREAFSRYASHILSMMVKET